MQIYTCNSHYFEQNYYPNEKYRLHKEAQTFRPNIHHRKQRAEMLTFQHR
jgi:hypothetical protein